MHVPFFARLLPFALLPLAAALAAREGRGQQSSGDEKPAPSALRGVVQSTAGLPIAGARLFVVETLEPFTSDSAGRFTIRTTASPPWTLLARAIGYREVQRLVAAADTGELVLVLSRATTTLSAVTIQAGAYTADESRGATLTPLQVVTTPGAAADLARAIQTLPGVQGAEEGNALFVRGGDYTETRIFLNEAPLLNSQQLATPSGTFIGTVDPFQLEGIFFSSGGFGARYGNALSGVAGLRTRGRTLRPAATASVGLAALSADVAIPLSPDITVRASANRFDLRPLFALNGAARDYVPPPRGRDLSAAAAWSYRDGAELKLFTIDQTNALGVGVDDPAYSGVFSSDDRTRLAVLTWRDVLGAWSPQVSLSRTTQDVVQGLGAFTLSGRTRQELLFAQVERPMRAGLTLRTGGDVEQLGAALAGEVPRAPAAPPGAATRVFLLEREAWRIGPFVEADWQASARLRVVAGLRADRSQLTRRWTADPRLSLGWRVGGATTVTAAWGLYHQVASPLQYDPTIGDPRLPAMRAQQRVIGVQLGEGEMQLRAEAYDKSYTALVQQRRDNVAVGGGVGSARGVDLFFKGSLPFGLTSRTTLSVLRARRTDPNTGTMAPAPFDVTTSATTILEQLLSGGLRLAVSWRSARGRPFTPVVDAMPDSVAGEFVPVYGEPYADRLPSLRRLDLSASWYRPLTPQWRSVWFVALNNILDRVNVQSYTWSSDYRERIPVRSIFNRSVYFGVTLLRE